MSSVGFAPPCSRREPSGGWSIIRAKSGSARRTYWDVRRNNPSTKQKSREAGTPSRLRLFRAGSCATVGRHDGTLAELAASGRKSRQQEVYLTIDRSASGRKTPAGCIMEPRCGDAAKTTVAGDDCDSNDRIEEPPPFGPLEIRLCDGERIMVEQPYQIATRANSPSCIIYTEDERMRIVAYRNITEVITAVNGE